MLENLYKANVANEYLWIMVDLELIDPVRLCLFMSSYH